MPTITQGVPARHSAGDFSTEPLAHSINAFCRAIGLGRTKVYSLIGEGKLKTIKVGRRRLIPAAEAMRLAREGSE